MSKLKKALLAAVIVATMSLSGGEALAKHYTPADAQAVPNDPQCPNPGGHGCGGG